MTTTLRDRKALRELRPPEPVASDQNLSALSKIVYVYLWQHLDRPAEERCIVLEPFCRFLGVPVDVQGQVGTATRELIERLGPCDATISKWRIFDAEEKRVFAEGESLSYETYALREMITHPENCYITGNAELLWSIMCRDDISQDAKLVWHTLGIIDHDRYHGLQTPDETSLPPDSFVVPVWASKLGMSIEQTRNALYELQQVGMAEVSESRLGADVLDARRTGEWWHEVAHLFPV